MADPRQWQSGTGTVPIAFLRGVVVWVNCKHSKTETVLFVVYSMHACMWSELTSKYFLLKAPSFSALSLCLQTNEIKTDKTNCISFFELIKVYDNEICNSCVRYSGTGRRLKPGRTDPRHQYVWNRDCLYRVGVDVLVWVHEPRNRSVGAGGAIDPPLFCPKTFNFLFR